MEPTRPIVLLVDDSPFFLTVEQQFLRRLPVAVTTAESADEALRLCREQRPALVYLAADLDGGRGAECCARIKGDPALGAIPVVLVCNEDAGEAAEAGRQAGCDGLVSKPLDRRRFVDVGRNFLAALGEPRRHCLVNARLRIGDRTLAARGIDLSTGGIFIESVEPLAPDTAVELDVQMGRPADGGPWIRCRGRVGWVNTRQKPTKQGYPGGFGVRFLALPEVDRRLLQRYLKTIDH